MNESLRSEEDVDDGVDLLDIAVPVIENWILLVAGALAAGLAALVITYLIPATYTARTTFLPPQQQQSVAASAIASLGALSGLAGSIANVKSPADQYVAMMLSATVSDRLIDEFKLREVYDAKFRVDARKELSNNVRIAVGKKDGLISVEVDDKSPQQAAAMANRYVDHLRDLTGHLAVSEAQQRRAFFDVQLKQTRDKLTAAQQALAASGFNQGALKAEPKAAAEGYARLKAEVTAAEVRLQTLRRGLVDAAPEVQQQQATVAALRSQLSRLEAATDTVGDPDYVSKYREFKYQETLFELFARQYELARVDESREGALIQVVDAAQPPERRSKPKRALTAIAATLAAGLLLSAFVVLRHFWRQSATHPATAAKHARLRAALRRG